MQWSDPAGLTCGRLQPLWVRYRPRSLPNSKDAHPAGEPVVPHRWGIQAIVTRKAGEVSSHFIPVQTRNLRSEEQEKTRGSSYIKSIALRMDQFKEHEGCGAAITQAGHQQSCLQNCPQLDLIGFFTVNTGQPLAVDGKSRFRKLRNEKRGGGKAGE